jgi:3-hydroxy-9,10-secoandrosta-1,3,5(10)-triene-9,17-dione monooxygenase reductase component
MTLDKTQFRGALGSFPTGVTIVTTLDGEAQPVGVTASSFNSVSLDPPLVLWSLSRAALSSEAFRTSGHFAIHVLAADQHDLSDRFARSGVDKFAGIAWQGGELGSPVFDHYAALFECRTLHQYEGGDHVIYVGEVVAFDRREQAPLVFHGGRYAEARTRDDDAERETVDLEHGAFSEDFLFFLLSRAHQQASRPARALLGELGLDEREYLVLVTLSVAGAATAEQIARSLAATGLAPEPSLLDKMTERGLLTHDGDRYDLADKGRDYHIRVLSVAKAFENDLLARLSPEELHETKRLLRRIIDLTATPGRS